MLKRWSFWIPVGVAIGLAVALGFIVDEPFGDNLGSYISAVSTIVLVAVTTSYVVATFEMSRTAQDQLAFSRRQREIDTVTRLWETYCDLRETAKMVRGDIVAMKSAADENVNRFYNASDGRDARAVALIDFRSQIRKAAPHLDTKMRASALDVAKQFGELGHLSRTISVHINLEIVTTTRGEGRGFDIDEFRPRWDAMTENLDGDLPAWDDITFGGDADRTTEAEMAFIALAQDRIGRP